MRKLFLALLLILALLPGTAEATKVYGCTALTGGGTGALDALDGADLLDKDMAVCVVGGISYTYYLDDDSGASEVSPGVIAPNAHAGLKRWILSADWTQKVTYPQWYGAVGDGTTDDSDAWVAAIASLTAGGVIDGGGKTYVVNTHNLTVEVSDVLIRNCTLKRTSTLTGWMLAWAQAADTVGGGLVDVTLIGNPLVAAAGGVVFGSASYKADSYTVRNVTAKTFGQYGVGIEYGSNWLIDGVRVLEHGLTTGTLTSCIGFYVYPKTASSGGVLSNIYSEMSAGAVANTDLNAAAMKLQTHQNLTATNLTAIYGTEETLAIDSVQGIISNVTVIPQGIDAGLSVGNYNEDHSFGDGSQKFTLDGVRIVGTSTYGFVIGGGTDGHAKLTGCTIRNMTGMYAKSLNLSNTKDCVFENWTFDDIRLSTTYNSQTVNSVESTGNTYRNINITGGSGTGVLAIEASDSLFVNVGGSPVTGDTVAGAEIVGDDNVIHGFHFANAASNALKITGSQNQIFYPSLYAITGRSIWFPVGSDTNVVYGLPLAGTGALDSGSGNLFFNRPRRSGATATVADGGTVTHGLGTTPTWVTVNPSTSGEFVSVTAIGATTFTVAIKKHDGNAGTTQTLYWQCGL